jgi:hypothetical protein
MDKELVFSIVLILILGSIAGGIYLRSAGSDNKVQPVNTADPTVADPNDAVCPPKDIDPIGNTNTEPENTNTITIENVGKYTFEPEVIKSVRSDIFKNGYFSLFDILVNIDSNKEIDMDFYFNESMNTNVINSINGKENWWYRAYYSGGWLESNAFRMDHYPYKDNSTIILYQESKSVLNDIFDKFAREVRRVDSNDGKIVIPTVIINGKSKDYRFNDVEVTSHNLRNDSFQEGVITAIDVIMTLGDLGKIYYELKWYETVGTADPVKTYFVHRLGNDEAYDRCGWVFEEGDYGATYYSNHIHIPSDQRILNSPEYEEWFWICI